MTTTRGTSRRDNIFFRILRFYMDGFRNMTVGWTLWKVIIIKLIIMFGVLKLFFFPNFLNSQFSTDEQKADYVLEQITVLSGQSVNEIRR